MTFLCGAGVCAGQPCQDPAVSYFSGRVAVKPTHESKTNIYFLKNDRGGVPLLIPFQPGAPFILHDALLWATETRLKIPCILGGHLMLKASWDVYECYSIIYKYHMSQGHLTHCVLCHF